MHFKKHFFFTPDADLLSLWDVSQLFAHFSQQKRYHISASWQYPTLNFLVGFIKNLIFSTFVGVLSQMMLTPAMQGVILAIAKARQTFDKEGPEAGLIKVCVCLFF